MSGMKSRLANLPRWFRFAMVGGLGFIVDGSILAAGVHVFGMDPVNGRGISFSCAIVVTWLFNRGFTFNIQQSSLRGTEFFRYFASGLLGLAVNLGTYLAVINEVPLTARYPLLALILASALAAVFNYWSSSNFVFSHTHRN